MSPARAARVLGLLLAGLLVTVVTAAPAQADWSSSDNLATAGQRIISDPLTGYDASGRAYAVWVDYRYPADDAVWLRERPPGGVWGAPQLLPTNGTGYVRSAQFAVDPAGDLVLTWYGNGVSAIRRPAGSSTWSAVRSWNSVGTAGPGSGCPNEPNVSSGGDGTTVIAWTSYQSCNGNVTRWRVQSVTWTPATGWQSTPTVLSISSVDVHSRPGVSVAADGSAVMAVIARNSSQNDELWTLEAPAGGTWGAAVLRGGSGSTNYSPAVAQRAGTTVVAWYGQSPWAVLRTNRSWGSQTFLSPGQAQPGQLGPSVAVDGAGTAYVAWSSLAGGSRSARLATAVSGGGFTDSVISSIDNAMDPQVAVNAAGDLGAVWTTVRSGSWYAASSLRPAGGSWQPTNAVTTVTSDNNPLSHVAVDEYGHVLAAAVPIGVGFGKELDATIETRDAPVGPASPVSISPSVAFVGDTVTCDPSGFGGTGPFLFAYQWFVEASPVGGATSASYLVRQPDAGLGLTCQVTATNDAGSATSTSDALVVGSTAPAFTSATTLSGTVQAGQTVTCVAGATTGAPAPDLTYEWLRSGTPIAFETATTYDVVVSDAGAAIGCRTTATNAAGTAQSASATVTVPAVSLPQNTTLPAVTPASGSGLGTVLTCSQGSWQGQPTPTYAWYWLRDGVQIPGGYGPTWTVVAADAATTLTCQVTASNPVGDTTVTAKGSVAIPPPPTNSTLPVVRAAVGSTFAVGGTAQCTSGGWKNALTYTYQWLRNGNPISGETAALHALGPADAGQTLSCVVTATGRGGTGTAVSLGKALAAPPAATVQPSITGTARPGKSLSCNRGSWTNANSFAYAWLRNGTIISGVTSTSLKLVASDVGTTMTCRVTASGTGGSTQATSAGVLVGP